MLVLGRDQRVRAELFVAELGVGADGDQLEELVAAVIYHDAGPTGCRFPLQ
jgi:hypothetical protein